MPLILNGDGSVGPLSATEVGYLDGVTSPVQTQINLKSDYSMPRNTQSGTTYNFVLTDTSSLVVATNASAKTFTIPPQSSVQWPNDAILRIVNFGAASLTISGGAGVSVTNAVRTILQYESGIAIRTGTDAWTLVPFASGLREPNARYWRYSVGSTITGHHPRVSRIMLVDQTNQAIDVVNFTSDNCSDSGTIPGQGTTYTRDYGQRIAIRAAQIYSTFGGGTRSSNYSVEYSNDNVNWTTSFSGVMSSATGCGVIAGTGSLPI